MIIWFFNNQLKIPMLGKSGNRDIYIHNACKECDYNNLKVLLKEGLNPNFTNLKGNTPLHILCKSNALAMENPESLIQKTYLDCRNLLIKYGAMTDIKNKKGNTVLHIACKYGVTDFIKHSNEYPVKHNLKNNKNKTPFHIVCENESIIHLNILINNYGNRINWKYISNLSKDNNYSHEIKSYLNELAGKIYDISGLLV